MSTGRVRIRVGAVEVEYEGSEEFMKDELPILLEGVQRLVAETPRIAPGSRRVVGEDGEAEAMEPRMGEDRSGTIDLSVNSVAMKLSATSGRDMVFATAAFLTLVKGQDTFDRNQLREAMKGAHNFYKESYTSNLSGYLSSATKGGELIERSNGKFALSAGGLDRARAALEVP